MSAIKASKKDDVVASDIDDAALSSETETVSVTPEEGADPESDSSKLKVLLGVLKKVVGVKVKTSTSMALLQGLRLHAQVWSGLSELTFKHLSIRRI
jgi:hypothetical protein